MAKLTQTIKDTAVNFVREWNVPARGNYVPNKEFVTFAAGGIGVRTVYGMITYIQMMSTSLLLSAVYRLSPMSILILFLITNVVSILKTPIASWLMDNTNTRFGKFRPYLLWAGLPCMIGVLGMVFWVPLDGTVVEKMVAIGIFFSIFIVSQQIYFNAYTMLTQVISPNTGERNKILSIGDTIASLGPSIVTLFMPIFAAALFGESAMTDIRSYRVLLPIFTVLGFLLGLLVMFRVKERVILPKQEKQRVKFSEGFRLVCRNRDFWIVTFSRLTNGFKTSLTLLLGWICLYQLHSSTMYGILPTIVNIAYVPGMLLAPLLMKKIGNGKAAFIAWTLNTIASVIMLFTFRQGVAFFVIMLFVFNMALGPQFIMQTSITADALDEIQLRSGKRVEGFAQNFQLMFELIGNIGAQVVFFIIYQNYGLVPGADGFTNYDILENAAIRDPIIGWTILIAIIASALVAVPFLFSKMTNKRHQEIIEELEKRKFYEENRYVEDNLITEAELETMYAEYVMRKALVEKGEFGETHVKKDKFTGAELHELMSNGVDINATSDRKLRKLLKEHKQKDEK